MKTRVDEMLEHAELIRENGDSEQAISILTEAIRLAQRMDDRVLTARALGHRIVCYKHLWQNLGLQKYLRLMQEDIDRGLALDVESKHRAAFYLRKADIHASCGESVEAEENYRQAYQLVGKGNYTEGEYLGHWAESLVDVGRAREAVYLLLKAILIVTSDRKIPAWHRLIVHSGLYGRLSKAAWKARKPVTAIIALGKCWTMSRRLARDYNMPQRLKQFHLRLCGKGV